MRAGELLPGLGTDRRSAPPWVVRLLLVRCGPYRLGFQAEGVLGVAGAAEVVPCGVGEVEGLLWREGVLLPVTGLGPLLGLPDPAGVPGGHGVIVRLPLGPLCFTVDAAEDLVVAPVDLLFTLPHLVSRAMAVPAIVAVALLDPLVLVVDPIQLLAPDRAARLLAIARGFGGGTSPDPIEE